MKKNDFIATLADAACIDKKSAKHAFAALATNIQLCLAHDGRIVLPGIGILTVTARPARAGRNPRTGDKVQIPAGKKITFRAAKELKDAV